MGICDSSVDFIFPLYVDIYYPIVTQDGYGDVKRRWVFDRTAPCFFGKPGKRTQESVMPEANIIIDSSLVGRVKTDLTQDNRGEFYSLNNILLTNIRDRNGSIIFNESSGPRVGLATVYEVAGFVPAVGPLGTTDHFSVALRRSENQAVNI